MQELMHSAKSVLQENDNLPFSVYSSRIEQRIFNVPVIQPLLICVLSGSKKLGKENEISCSTGSFIFLSNSPEVDMRNIPEDTEYFALLIDFCYSDFDCFPHKRIKSKQYIQGQLDPLLISTLQQFVEWSAYAPSELWALRRQEILQLLYHQGYEQLGAIVKPPSLGHQVYGVVNDHFSDELSVGLLASKLAMSESTLRRKLKAEGTSVQAIKDRVRLGHGLHRVQTTQDSIGRIAEQCGYQSQSRFTDKFKQLFGLTPTELRKTIKPD